MSRPLVFENERRDRTEITQPRVLASGGRGALHQLGEGPFLLEDLADLGCVLHGDGPPLGYSMAS